MAKQNGNALASQMQQPLALPEDFRGGAHIEGMDQAQTLIGRLAMYNGTTQEQELYAGLNFQPGQYIDVLEKRVVASTRIVPLGGYVTWMCWPQGARRPDYVVRDRSQVPQSDLEWNGDTPPRATQCINVIVAVEGEPWPYLFVFKRTSYKAGQTMMLLEGRRSVAKRGRGLYMLGSTKEKNKAGQTYHEVTVSPCGDCPESLVPLVLAFEQNSREIMAKAKDVENTVIDGDASERGANDEVPV